jgi:hypothetical protein
MLNLIRKTCVKVPPVCDIKYKHNVPTQIEFICFSKIPFELRFQLSATYFNLDPDHVSAVSAAYEPAQDIK